MSDHHYDTRRSRGVRGEGSRVENGSQHVDSFLSNTRTDESYTNALSFADDYPHHSFSEAGPSHGANVDDYHPASTQSVYELSYSATNWEAHDPALQNEDGFVGTPSAPRPSEPSDPSRSPPSQTNTLNSHSTYRDHLSSDGMQYQASTAAGSSSLTIDSYGQPAPYIPGSPSLYGDTQSNYAIGDTFSQTQGYDNVQQASHSLYRRAASTRTPEASRDPRFGSPLWSSEHQRSLGSSSYDNVQPSGPLQLHQPAGSNSSPERPFVRSIHSPPWSSERLRSLDSSSSTLPPPPSSSSTPSRSERSGNRADKMQQELADIERESAQNREGSRRSAKIKGEGNNSGRGKAAAMPAEESDEERDGGRDRRKGEGSSRRRKRRRDTTPSMLDPSKRPDGRRDGRDGRGGGGSQTGGYGRPVDSRYRY